MLIENAKLLYTPNEPLGFGEGPIYSSSDDTLHFHDFARNETYILPIDPKTGGLDETRDVKTLDTGVSITMHSFIKERPGFAICLFQQGIGLLNYTTGELSVLKKIVPDESKDKMRLNDGAVDAKGRLWGGEMDIGIVYTTIAELNELREKHNIVHFDSSRFPEKGTGRMWRYDPDGQLHHMDDGFLCFNGVCWSPDNKTMYASDSMYRKTYAYDYDLETGSISNKRVLKDFSSSAAGPDGTVVDTDGNLWIAMCGEGKVVCLSPGGDVVREVHFPTFGVTCPTWGKDEEILYVVSSTAFNDNPQAGCVFACDLRGRGIRGMRKFEF